MAERIYGISAGEGIEIGTTQPVEVRVAESLELSGDLHMLDGADPSIPTIGIGPYTDTTGWCQKSFQIQHHYNYTGSPMGFGVGTVGMPFWVFSQIEGAPDEYIWAGWFQQILKTTGTSIAQHGGLAVTSQRHSGATPYFLLYLDHMDMTGVPPSAFAQSVGLEMDISANGPEDPSSSWNPGAGARNHHFIQAISWRPPVWAANTAYAKDTTIWPSAGHAHVYVCTVAGTSGSTPPTWPTAPGTFTDGTVTWKYGTTWHMELSRTIGINTTDASIGAGVFLAGSYYDAPIDMSFATLDLARNPNACGIRLAPNMNIDFTGGMSAATQNLHKLGWESTTQRLYYATGAPLFSIGDDGTIRMIVPADAINDAAAAGAGVAVGGIYRNGSVLQVRVA